MMETLEREEETANQSNNQSLQAGFQSFSTLIMFGTQDKRMTIRGNLFSNLSRQRHKSKFHSVEQFKKN